MQRSSSHETPPRPDESHHAPAIAVPLEKDSGDTISLPATAKHRHRYHAREHLKANADFMRGYVDNSNGHATGANGTFSNVFAVGDLVQVTGATIYFNVTGLDSLGAAYLTERRRCQF
jgi:hypothetical protein